MITLTFTAGDGKDYTSGPYDVNIPAGQLEVFFSIAIHDDNIKENYENFTVNIDQSSLPSYIIVDNSSEAVVDIADDDCECVSVICSMEGLAVTVTMIYSCKHSCSRYDDGCIVKAYF